MSNAYRHQIAVAVAGDELTIRLVRDPRAEAVAFDPHAPMVDRVLAAAAAGTMRPAMVEALIRDDPTLRVAVLALAEAAAGAQLTGDVVTLRVHRGGR